MPGLDGLEVFALLKEVDPRVKVVMISADVQTRVQDEARRLGIMRFISKPITMDALRSVLEEYGE
jgi:response regulator of citrate/malate metabolism